MGVESVFNYTEKIKAIDVKGDGIKDGLKENIIKQKAINYVNANRKSLNKEELNLLINKIDILLRKQDIEKLNLKSKFEELKKQTIIESKINISKVKKLDIHDIKSPAGLSHYIDKSGDEKMKALEEYLGVDNLWKIIALTTIYTGKEVGKGFTDILKIGEGAAEGSLALDRNDLSTLQRIFELTKGVGIDGLRAIALIPGIGILLNKLGKVLSKINLPNSLLKPLTNEIGAVGNIEKIRKTKIAIDKNKIDLLEMKGTYMLDETKNLHPVEAGKKIGDFADKIDVKYLINHPERIDTMLDIVENQCEYVVKNKSRILGLKKEEFNYFKANFMELRLKITRLGKEDVMSNFIDDIIKLREGKLKQAYNSLF